VNPIYLAGVHLIAEIPAISLWSAVKSSVAGEGALMKRQKKV